MSRLEINHVQNFDSTSDLSWQNLLNTSLSRRNLLRVAGAAGIAAALAACGVKPKDTKSPSPETTSLEMTPTDELFTAFDELPDSPLKAAVVNQASLYFLPNSSKTVSLGGENFKVYNPQVSKTFTTDETVIVNGEFSDRDTGIDLGPKYISQEVISVLIPIPGILTSDETNQMSPENRTSDGTFALKFFTQKGFGEMVDSLSPRIKVSISKTYTAESTKKAEILTKMAYVKEACSLFVNDALISRIVKKMHEFNTPTEVLASDKDGKLQKINYLPEFLALLISQSGRYRALLDLCGYFFLAKLAKETPMETIMKEDPTYNFSAVLDSVGKFPIETNFTVDEMLQSAIDWSLSAGKDININYQGDINKIP